MHAFSFSTCVNCHIKKQYPNCQLWHKLRRLFTKLCESIHGKIMNCKTITLTTSTFSIAFYANEAVTGFPSLSMKHSLIKCVTTIPRKLCPTNDAEKVEIRPTSMALQCNNNPITIFHRSMHPENNSLLIGSTVDNFNKPALWTKDRWRGSTCPMCWIKIWEHKGIIELINRWTNGLKLWVFALSIFIYNCRNSQHDSMVWRWQTHGFHSSNELGMFHYPFALLTRMFP